MPESSRQREDTGPYWAKTREDRKKVAGWLRVNFGAKEVCGSPSVCRSFLWPGGRFRSTDTLSLHPFPWSDWPLWNDRTVGELIEHLERDE